MHHVNPVELICMIYLIKYLTQLTRVQRRHSGVTLHASYQQNNSIMEQQNIGPFLGTEKEGTRDCSLKMLVPTVASHP